MIQVNESKFRQVIETALVRAGSSRRWKNAIVRAAVEIEVNPFMHWNGQALVIWSPSNEIYEANGTCQCKAYRNGQPCWHRAAARLVRRYNETAH